MKDDNKTKKQLVHELTELRSQNAVLEKSIAGYISAELAAEESSRYAESIVETVREPLLVLDADLRIVSANRNFYRTYKVTPGETIGSYIYALGNKQWDIPRLRELLEDVLPEKEAFDDFEVDHNFRDIGHKIMLLNAREIYRKDIGAKIILLAIEDITVRREIENGLERTRKELAVIKIAADEVSEYAESLINTIREPLIALDQDLRVVTASRSFYDFFKVKPDETVGQLIYNLGNKQWDIPKLRELLETILPEKATFNNYEVEHDFATIGRRIMLLNARQIERVMGKERIILLAIEDITERKEIEAGLEKTRKELAVIKIAADEASEFAESVINTVREPLISLDQDLRVVTVSRSFYEFFKVNPEETVGQLIYDLGNKQWDIPKLRELLETILPEKTTFDNYEVEHDFATIGRRIMLLNARQIERGLGEERIILLAIEDITERKKIEAGLEKTRKELAVIKIAADEVSEYAKSVINTVREPLIALDQDLRVVTASRSFYNFFKVKPEETVGQLIYDLGNNQWDIPKLRELLETILPEKATFDNYEVEHDFATIGRRIMLLNARQIKRVFGKERIILLAIEDITERKRLENLLIDSEEQYRRLFETASDGIVLLEKREGRITQANPATEKLLGYTEKESIGNSLKDIGVVLDTSDFQTTMQNLNKRGILNYRNVTVETKSGQHIDTEIYLVDRAKLVQCNIRDTTERKQAKEQILRQSKLLTAINSVFSEMLTANSEDSVARVCLNVAQEITDSKFGFIGEITPEGLFTTTALSDPGWESCRIPETQANVLLKDMVIRGIWGQVILKKQSLIVNDPVSYPDRVGIPEGHPLLTSFLGVPLKDQDKVIGMIAMANRVSGYTADHQQDMETLSIAFMEAIRRKKAEEEIKKLNTELEQRVIDRTAQLSAANKELDAFSYSVSHDLRAPLRSIDGFSQALLEEYQGKPLDDTGKNYLERVRKATQRMGLLIEDMLKLSRITQAEMKRGAVDLSGMIREIAEEHQKSNPERAVDVTIQERITVQGDPYLINIAIENLVNNAFKFTGKATHPRIEFGTTVRDGKTACFIRDNGAGFDMAYLDKLFGAFQRLHTTDEFSGTGIGLATVKRIINRHGGQLWAEGEVGKGATFFFTLPS